MTTPQGGLRVEDVGSVGRGVEVLARRAVGGRVDASAVLVLRAVRRLWFPSLVLGFVAALPRARAELVADHERRRAVLARGADPVFLAGALRSLRLTAAGRDVAAARLGAPGRVALVVDRVETWLGPAGAVVLVLVLLVRS